LIYETDFTHSTAFLSAKFNFPKTKCFRYQFCQYFIKGFFIKNPVIDSVVVQDNRYAVYLKTKWENTTSYQNEFRSYDYYNFNFLGDVYRFENRYGKMLLPEKKLKIILENACSKWCSLKMRYNPDSIHCQRKCTCPSNEPSDDYDLIFTKVETLARIKNGTGELQNQIQEAYKNLKNKVNISTVDSVFIYKVLVDRKDSCLQSIELTEGYFSPFEQMVMDVLKGFCLWIPAEQGGRSVSFYSSVFVRLNKDDSITVDVVK
jgi:hypothetical protein